MVVSKLNKYLSLVKFSHTIFAMPFAIIGLVLGFMQSVTPFSWQIALLVVLCMVFARNAAMSFNRVVDQKFDTLNPRTANRELPTGVVSKKKAIGFVIINALAFITATFFINRICFVLSPIALAVVLGYSYTKRFTALSHLILGIGLALAPIGAYLAVTGQFSIIPVLLGVVVLFWVAGFDIIYSLQDFEFDRNEKLNSLPVLLGKPKALIASRFFHFLSVLALLIVGWKGSFGLLFWIGSFVFVVLLAYQHSIVKANDLSRVNLAFFIANGIASMVFAILVIADLLYKNQAVTV